MSLKGTKLSKSDKKLFASINRKEITKIIRWFKPFKLYQREMRKLSIIFNKLIFVKIFTSFLKRLILTFELCLCRRFSIKTKYQKLRWEFNLCVVEIWNLSLISSMLRELRKYNWTNSTSSSSSLEKQNLIYEGKLKFSR